MPMIKSTLIVDDQFLRDALRRFGIHLAGIAPDQLDFAARDRCRRVL